MSEYFSSNIRSVEYIINEIRNINAIINSDINIKDKIKQSGIIAKNIFNTYIKNNDKNIQDLIDYIKNVLLNKYKLNDMLIDTLIENLLIMNDGYFLNPIYSGLPVVEQILRYKLNGNRDSMRTFASIFYKKNKNRNQKPKINTINSNKIGGKTFLFLEEFIIRHINRNTVEHACGTVGVFTEENCCLLFFVPFILN